MRSLLSSCLALLALLSLSLPSYAQNATLPPSISVTGTGKASGSPDVADVTVGVVTVGTNASLAVSSNNQAMTSLMAALKALGIAERDIQTSNFSVHPEYRNPEPEPRGGDQRPQISGFRASNEVRVTVRNVSSLGQVLDQVVKGGANSVHGVSFTFSDNSAVADDARRKALADARRKAELFAQSAGVKLGRILYINESGANVPFPMPMMEMRQAGGVPVSVGSQDVNANITVVYAIDPS